MPIALAPMRTPGFSNLAFSYVVNELGNWLGEIALAVLVFDATSSTIATAGLFLAMQVLPSALGPALVARLEPVAVRAALPALYAGEATAFVVLAVLAHHFSLAAVLAVAALDGLLATAARALTRASVASLLEPEDLLREGNSLLNFGFTGAAALGPALAGAVVAGAGADSALLVDAGSFLGAAALVALARGLPRPAPGGPGWRQRLSAALDHVRSRPALRLLLFAQAAALVFFAAVIPIEVAFAKRSLDAGNFGYGALLASWGAGTVLGAVVFARLRRRELRALIGWSTLTVGVAYLLTGVSPTLLLACAASVLGGAGNGVQYVAIVTAVQELTASAFQARIASLLDAVTRAAPGVGFVLGGLAAAALSPRAAYVVAGAGVLGSWPWPARGWHASRGRGQARRRPTRSSNHSRSQRQPASDRPRGVPRQRRRCAEPRGKQRGRVLSGRPEPRASDTLRQPGRANSTFDMPKKVANRDSTPPSLLLRSAARLAALSRPRRPRRRGPSRPRSGPRSRSAAGARRPGASPGRRTGARWREGSGRRRRPRSWG